MPDVKKLLAQSDRENERQTERTKADKARLRKFERARDWQGFVQEVELQLKESRARSGHDPGAEKLRVELEATREKFSSVRADLFFATLEKRRLEAEVLRLRAVLGERDGAIQFPAADHTPETISGALEALGYRASKRTLLVWLGEWHDRKNMIRPTRYRFVNDERGRDLLKDFLEFCRKTRKLRPRKMGQLSNNDAKKRGKREENQG